MMDAYFISRRGANRAVFHGLDCYCYERPAGFSPDNSNLYVAAAAVMIYPLVMQWMQAFICCMHCLYIRSRHCMLAPAAATVLYIDSALDDWFYSSDSCPHCCCVVHLVHFVWGGLTDEVPGIMPLQVLL